MSETVGSSAQETVSQQDLVDDAIDGATVTGSGRRRSDRIRMIPAGVALALVAFVAVTGVTGLPAPGPFERHPYGDLRALADAVHAEAGDFRTPDDCWRTLHGNSGPLRSVAGVDYVRSRVVVRAYSADSGVIDPRTFSAVVERIDDLVADDPHLSWSMVEIEASPGGWSPLLSCRLVTRGWARSS